MLLDGRWLPGCEGGVAITEDGQPCALLAAPLRSTRGCRWTLCPGIALRGILTTILNSFAGQVLPRSLKESARPAKFAPGVPWPPGIARLEVGAEAFGCVLISDRHILVVASSLPRVSTGRLHGAYVMESLPCRVQLLQPIRSLGLVLAEVDFMPKQKAPEAIQWPGVDVDLQEGQDLVAVDLEGPKMAKGVLQCWLGARHQPQAPPALECGLPSPGLSQAHFFFEARTHALFGIALADKESSSSCSRARVLPVRCHGVSVFQLKELQQCLSKGPQEVNSAMRLWINSFDARWTPLKGNLEWRLEARPFAATSAL